MDIGALQQPLSDDQPCGPDLFEADDDGYFSATNAAQAVIPEKFYFIRGMVGDKNTPSTPDWVFDPKSIDIRPLASQLDGVLARSRDLRILALRAQLEALAGRLAPMAEAIEGMALLLETYPSDVHPTLADGISDRRDALSELNSQIAIEQPLYFAGLTGGNEVSLRRIRVARGEITPLAHEADQNLGALISALAASENRQRVTESHAALARMQDGVERIARACLASPRGPFTPPLDRLRDTVAAMLELIQNARPDLLPSPAPPEPQALADAGPDDSSDGAGGWAGSGADAQAPGQSVMQMAAVQIGAFRIANQEDGRALLEACEAYYRRHEPSSAALLLVTQARLLIGRPLVEVLETLLPQMAAKALIDFGPQMGFQLGLDRLKSLSQQSHGGAEPPPPAEAPRQDPPKIASGPEAAAALRATEDYFRRAERSSPVPLLLQRARSYLEKDFQALIDELMPREK